MLCVIYLTRNVAFVLGGRLLLKANNNSLEFDKLKRTHFLGPLITCGNVWLSARLSEAPLYCTGVYLCAVLITLMSV